MKLSVFESFANKSLKSKCHVQLGSIGDTEFSVPDSGVLFRKGVVLIQHRLYTCLCSCVRNLIFGESKLCWLRASSLVGIGVLTRYAC